MSGAGRSFGGRIQFYQTSFPEMYGNTMIPPQGEQTPFRQGSEYATVNLYVY